MISEVAPRLARPLRACFRSHRVVVPPPVDAMRARRLPDPAGHQHPSRDADVIGLREAADFVGVQDERDPFRDRAVLSERGRRVAGLGIKYRQFRCHEEVAFEALVWPTPKEIVKMPSLN